MTEDGLFIVIRKVMINCKRDPAVRPDECFLEQRSNMYDNFVMRDWECNIEWVEL